MLDARPTELAGVVVSQYTPSVNARELSCLRAHAAVDRAQLGTWPLVAARDAEAHALATRAAAERMRAEVYALDKLVDGYRANNDSRGYFAAVYREMTASVWRCLEPGSGQRRITYPTLMADFIHLFARRYTDALAAPSSATESWQVAFASGNAPLVVHLLTSMNAHIRLDLGLSLAEATRTELRCQLFRKDFDIINKLVSGYDPANDLTGVATPRGMVDGVAVALRRAAPSTALLDGALGGLMRRALSDRIVLERVHVVDVAEAGIAALRSHEPGAWRQLVQRRDREVARAGRRLLASSGWTRGLHKLARLFERPPREIIDALRPPACALTTHETSAYVPGEVMAE